MARFLFALVAFVAALAILKMILVALVIAGLIFRTKTTLGLLLLGGLGTLTASYPLAGGICIALVLVLIVAFYRPSADTSET